MSAPRALLALALLAPATAAAQADGAGDAGLLGLGASTGTLRSSYWTSSREVDGRDRLGTLTLWVRAAPRLGAAGSLVVDGWFGYLDLSGDDVTTGSVREAYLDLQLGRLDVRAGKRIIAWGRADAVNPTDNLTPRDYTLLVADDADQRFGVYSAELALHAGSLSFTGIWLPGFQPNVVPLPSSPTFRERSPGWVESQAQVAFKVEQSGERVDWSLSYFDGHDRSPDIAMPPGIADQPDMGMPPGAATELVLLHRRTRVIGGDLATVAGRVQVRGEAAFTATEDMGGERPDVADPFLFAVIGADRTFGNHLNVNAQVLVRAVFHHASPFAIEPPEARPLAVQNAVVRNQLDPVQHGATLRIGDRWRNETIEAELLASILIPHESHALRAKLGYALSDRWKGILGFDYYNGTDPSFFRNLHATSTVFAELRLGF